MTCKKATYLISKKEEGRLSLVEKWQLMGHFAICRLCRKFEQQTRWIIRQTKQGDEHSDHVLSDEARRKLEQILT